MTYLTKSRFQIAKECPTKLYYHTHSAQYSSNKLNDPFLEALAEGGFQVGALARAYHPEGVLIDEPSNGAAVEKTNKFLQRENCVLFEAAIQIGSLFIRVDILRKTGTRIDLIEVKAKSFHPQRDSFINKRGEISSSWRPYLTDVAFQRMVTSRAYPEFSIVCYLMLADKSAIATVDGLNQMFRIVRHSHGFQVSSPQLTVEKLGEKVLIEVLVNKEVEIISQESFTLADESYTLNTFSDLMVADMANDHRRFIGIGKQCCKCEYQSNDERFSSGFRECWTIQTSLTVEEVQRPLLFDLWRGHLGRRDIITPLLNRGDHFLSDYCEADFSSPHLDTGSGFTPTERRWIQVQNSIAQDSSPIFNTEFLSEQFAQFKYPLHFIDFETTALAIPMYSGRRPYEQVAFQFSHHTIDEFGKIQHKTEWLNDRVGSFPNFEFIRELKKALENDEGTIFRYHNHENSVLCAIHSQLLDSQEVDREELCSFIRSITHKKGEYVGERDMVDLYELVIRGFYHISMKGSNSIKAVLPAVLESSEYLRNKYILPCYGTEEIPSGNFANHIWLQSDNDGKVVSPYKTLPPIFNGFDTELLDSMCMPADDQLADGGAAMMAYAKMQFAEMQPGERSLFRQALLRYCELDTMAMVMIYEGFRAHLLQNQTL